jgi:hypothetical protein
MSFFRSLTSKLATGATGVTKGATWLTEKLNFKTDHNLKGDLSELSDSKLISKRGSTVRSVASSVTGILANTAIAVACPIFVVPAVISAVQLGVSATNCYRAQREVKRRKKEKSGFEAQLRTRDVVKDVVIGGTVKAAFTALGAGIVGFDHIADNFADLAHKAGENALHALIAQHTADAVSNNAVHDSVGQILQHPHDTAALFKMNHPHIEKIDSVVHKGVGGVGEKIEGGMQHLTHMKIDQTTSWEGLKTFITNGACRATVFGQAAIVGFLGEITQFINQAGEIGVDEYLEHCDKTQIKKAKDILEKSQNLNGYLKGTELETRAKQHVQVLNALKADSKFQRLRTAQSAGSG